MHPHHAAAWRLMSSMVFGSCLDLRIQWKVRQQLHKLSRPTSEKFLRHRTSGKTSSIETTCLRIRRIKKHHVHVCIPTWYCLNISHRIYKNTCDHPVPYIIHTYGCGSKCKVWIKPRSHTRSRPPIQTFRKDLMQTFDPDLWNDIMYWWVDVWSSDGCMLLGFLLCSYSPCQAAKQQTVVKPRCQAVTLPSCTCRKVTLLSSQAVQQPSCNCCTSKLSNCQADTVASCKASLPSSQAAHLLPAHLVVLSLSCCIQAATYTNMWVHVWADPDPIQTTTTSSSVLKLVLVWFLSLLQTLGSQSINFGTHVNGTKSAYSQVESEVWTL